MRDAREGNITALLAFREQMAGMLSGMTAEDVGTMLAAAGGGVDDQEVAQRPNTTTHGCKYSRRICARICRSSLG